MDTKEIERLKYRRQYVIAAGSIEIPFLHKKTPLNDKYSLYSHLDLVQTDYQINDLLLVLLGDIFDGENSYKKNRDVLEDIAHHEFSTLIKDLMPYCGRFVLIYIKQDRMYMVHDATATRKIFYCNNGNSIWCASQPHLLAKVTNIHASNDPSRLSYFGSQRFKDLDGAGIGNTTNYDEIKQLRPNHYLNLTSGEVTRFWPMEQRVNIPLGECSKICAGLLEGYIKSIAARYKVMLPVTAGKDSRTLLAATRDLKNEVFYYVNHGNHLTDASKDIKVPTALFKQLGLDFHVLHSSDEVDQDFRQIYFENNKSAFENHLPIIYNYYQHFSDMVNLPGNVATGGAYNFPMHRKKITLNSLLEVYNMTNFEHARITYAEWLSETQDYTRDTDYLLFDLFYWEERLGNWGSQFQLDKDISQEEFNPFNSWLLIQTMFSMKNTFDRDDEPYVLNKGIIKHLWPEVLLQPINPGRKNKIFKTLHFFGLKGLSRKVFNS